MDYELKYDPESDLIIAGLSGTLDLAVVERMSDELREIIELCSCKKVFNDLRKIDIIQSVFDIYDMLRIMRRAKIPVDCRRALVVTQITETYLFLETVSVNAGQQVKLFTDPEAARKWLQQQSEEDKNDAVTGV